MDELRKTSAADQGRAIANGTTDARALTEVYLSAIAAHPHRDRIYVRTTPERARAEAAAAAERAKSGMLKGPLDGVPISWKDLYDVAGVGCEGGTKLLAGRIPDADCEVVRRGSAAGTICLGKTHTTEIAFSGLGVNPMAATPPNAIEPTRAPGGSSSGAAVSTKLDLAGLGIGSDTGGSVRIPAGWNDLVGLKTTAGQIPTTGVIALSRTYDTVGPLTKTVEDAAL
ncbi:MAG: amidase, partial [Pseudomonadota bacterium]